MMSTQTAPEGQRASTPPSKGVWKQRLFLVALPLVCTAIFILPLLPYFYLPYVDPVAVQLLQPDAVQVSASPDYGRTWVTRQITDPRTVADLYARLNGLHAVWGRYACVLAPPDPVDRRFQFTRRGRDIEDAQLADNGCAPPRWSVSHFGYQYMRIDPTGEQTKALLAEVQLPPLPSQP
jgi:hypothetical protein